ncbi:MAG TPA: hypothetical protein VKF41_02600 [Bryobacteraceae bacterium]|nr:hypothetical protein [Bryobacteraceae bacterium]
MNELIPALDLLNFTGLHVFIGATVIRQREDLAERIDQSVGEEDIVWLLCGEEFAERLDVRRAAEDIAE